MASGANVCWWWEAERLLSGERRRVADARSCGADASLAPPADVQGPFCEAGKQTFDGKAVLGRPFLRDRSMCFFGSACSSCPHFNMADDLARVSHGIIE